MTKRLNQHIFLLRMWQEEEGDSGDEGKGKNAGILRIHVVDPRTGARRAFPSMQELFHFLEQEVQTTSRTSAP